MVVNVITFCKVTNKYFWENIPIECLYIKYQGLAGKYQ